MESIDFTVDCDLTLIVDEILELRVSSETLQNASPVLKTMLGPKYAEGQALLSITSSLPQVELPDDDPDGMRLLCAALHSRNDLLPTKIDGTVLVSLLP